MPRSVTSNTMNSEGEAQIYGTRAIILEFVSRHPGTHLREIGRELGLGMGDLQYHIYSLEKTGIIKTVKHGLYRFVFSAGVFGDKQTAVLSALSLESEREILLSLSQKPGLTQLELAESIKLSPATIVWHMKRLVDQGIVERKRMGKFVRYTLAFDPEEIRRFTQSYHPAFWEKWASRLADTLLTLSAEEREVIELANKRDHESIKNPAPQDARVNNPNLKETSEE